MAVLTLLVLLLIPLIVWSVFWKGLGLWYSARNKDKIWFVVVLIFNTAGILPIIYLALKTDFFKGKKPKKKKSRKPKKKRKKR